MLCLSGIGACSTKPAPSVPSSDATVHCTTECVSVSKAFIKEHALLFDELIRTKAALEDCRKK